jgi:hypothetical protein
MEGHDQSVGFEITMIFGKILYSLAPIAIGVFVSFCVKTKKRSNFQSPAYTIGKKYTREEIMSQCQGSEASL